MSEHDFRYEYDAREKILQHIGVTCCKAENNTKNLENWVEKYQDIFWPSKDCDVAELEPEVHGVHTPRRYR